MQAVDRLQFAPPSAPGLLRSISLAILAHALLLVALGSAVNWHRGELLTVEAELWADLPQEAAPAAIETPPQPEPEPPSVPRQVTPEVSDADIALAREKERKALEDLALEQKRAEDRQKELEARKKEKLKAQRDSETRKKMREDQLKRMAGLANASGAPTASGTALKSAGPSANYAGRIVARVKPNIVFTEDISGNPRAEVEVRTSPDGTIVGSKLVKSSGSKSWDRAVLRAIDKTEVLPRNEDGIVPSPMTIGFRPRD